VSAKFAHLKQGTWFVRSRDEKNIITAAQEKHRHGTQMGYE